MRSSIRVAAAVCLSAGAAFAQLTERPGGTYSNPVDQPRDVSGLSIKTPRVRAICTVDPEMPGGTAWLMFVDPWMGYQRGRELFQREMRVRDGVFGETGKLDGPVLQDGVSKQLLRDNAASCATCHGTPYRDAGGGPVMAKNAGTGRKSPHLFGAGIIEMIAEQIRVLALEQVDADGNGWISFEEAKGKRCLIPNIPGIVAGDQQWIDYGRFDDVLGTGRPNLNGMLGITFVDKDGRRIAWARSLNDDQVAGYTIQVMTFMAGTLGVPRNVGLPVTLRAFTAQAADIHEGQQAADDTMNTPFGFNGWAQVSLAGQRQFITHATRDRGNRRRLFQVEIEGLLDPTKPLKVAAMPGVHEAPGEREHNRLKMMLSGVTKPSHAVFHLSLDDPDRDGYLHELSEGDQDLLEWYQLNHPSPARDRPTELAKRGEALMVKTGCTTCHVPDWHLYARDEKRGLAGDRRFFDLQTFWNEKTRRLEGKVVDLTTKVGNRRAPKYGSYTVRGVYSDFRFHDIGEKFYETQFDGSIVKRWRTRPLWGVANAGPWGHDGATMTLDEVIRRHGGEADVSRKAYEALSEDDQEAVQAFLRGLRLFQTDQLPTDMNGDGKISDKFVVAGVDTGVERFNPEWLFRIPARIEGWAVNVNSEKVWSFAVTNIREAYGLDLPLLRDRDGDGFPDVIDIDPDTAGYRNGKD